MHKISPSRGPPKLSTIHGNHSWCSVLLCIFIDRGCTCGFLFWRATATDSWGSRPTERSPGQGRRGRGRYQQQQVFGQPPPYFGQGPQHHQQTSSGRGANQQNNWGLGTVFCNTVKSFSYTPSLSTFCTNYASAGSLSLDDSFGLVPPPVLCQIYHSPGNSVVSCPSRFVQAQAPALVVSIGESAPAI
ncbi:unnamed protein product [Cuscuta europaea]|uniref:Uncharacterized protein n=1 Tax=Cuscuta europaea TaxID=41803 RepID=A0A9P0ZR13_CUSEU|nr:unnamed protein product [Cuscuta europaea]